MTVLEAHIAFKIEADKNAVNIGISGCPSFLPEEIDYWLYTAYLSKIATKATGNNTLRIPFEGNRVKLIFSCFIKRMRRYFIFRIKRSLNFSI